jgi:prephenate dehydrogenase
VTHALGSGDAAVFDVASVKAPVIDAVRAAAPADALARYVPAHPLAGSERGGWSSARPDLLDAAVWAICPHDLAAPLEPLAAVAHVLDALDARLCFCTPEDHDAAVARSSHVPHIVAQALAATIDTPLAAVLSGGALRDGTRVAAANPTMWEEVKALNAQAITPALGELVGWLENARDALVRGDADGVDWSDGGDQRRRIDALRWSDRKWHTAELPADWGRLVAETAAGGLVRRVRLDGASIAFERSSP